MMLHRDKLKHIAEVTQLRQLRQLQMRLKKVLRRPQCVS